MSPPSQPRSQALTSLLFPIPIRRPPTRRREIDCEPSSTSSSPAPTSPSSANLQPSPPMSFEEQKVQLLTRRNFLRRASCAAVGTWALSSTIRDLRLINSAMAQAAPPTDYKALV